MRRLPNPAGRDTSPLVVEVRRDAEPVVPPAEVAARSSPFPQLTEREHDVLGLLVQGLDDAPWPIG